MVLSEKTLYSLGRRCVYIFKRRKAKKEIPVRINRAISVGAVSSVGRAPALQTNSNSLSCWFFVPLVLLRRRNSLVFGGKLFSELFSRHCQVNETKPSFSPKQQESCDSLTDVRHLSPIGKSPCLEESMMLRFQMMTTGSEQVPNGTVY